MAGKKRGGNAANAGAANVDGAPRKITQAIVLADSFERQFSPITVEVPKSLLPVGNVPLIHYTIEWLASNAVDEVYVFCAAHARMIEAHLRLPMWRERFPHLRIQTVVSTGTISAGDALRDIHSRGVITSDFILVYGDTVSTIGLTEALEAHRARAKKDRGALLTTVLRRVPPRHETRSPGDSLTVAIDAGTNQLLAYEAVTGRTARVPGAVLEAHEDIAIRHDLMDTHIDICSPEFIFLFADNFDYQNIRRDLVQGILNEEILGNKVFAHIVEEEFAARVSCLRTYDAISKCILRRHSYPLVPEKLLAGTGSYSYRRGNVYIADNVQLARTTDVVRNSMIGTGAQIGEDVEIIDSIIGPGCEIGRKSRIVNSYIWNHCVIGEKVSITNSIICDRVQILRGCSVASDCILSYGTKVGPDTKVAARTHLSLLPVPSDDDDDDDERGFGETGDEIARMMDLSLEYDTDVVGTQGAGQAWPRADESSKRNLLSFRRQRAFSDGEMDDDPTDDSEEEEMEEPEDDGGFEREVLETVTRGLEESLPVANVALEIGGLRLAYDRALVDCSVGALGALLSNIAGLCGEDAAPKTIRAHAMKVLKKWSSIVSKYLSTSAERTTVLNAADETLKQHPVLYKVYPFILQLLYEKDVVDEDAIMAWAAAADGSEAHRAACEAAQPFVEWLRNAESESESD